MKIAICYPPFESEKGTPLLTQNRQFQWFSDACYIYPMVPAYLATTLKELGHEVFWLDGIAEKKKDEEYLQELAEINPDVIFLESKTPVIKRHWEFINNVKAQMSNVKIILTGDHVTALPEESMKKSKVDFVLTGGDYDFLFVNLIKNLAPQNIKKLEPGIYYRDGKTIKNTGKFIQNHDLNDLPLIDRDLTKWKLYAYDNGNYKQRPGTYTMAGRDCWWGKCTFCLLPEIKINTDQGFFPIQTIVENQEKFQVLTHLGQYQKIVDWHQRRYRGSIMKIEPHYLAEKISLTPDHNAYICKKENKNQPQIRAIPAKQIKKDDYLVLPIERTIKNIEILDLPKIIRSVALEIKTIQKIPVATIQKIKELKTAGVSQRQIVRELKIDRETVARYFDLIDKGEATAKSNPLVEREADFRFEGGKKSLPKQIKLTPDFMRLIGYYLAEGHVSWHKSRPNSAYLGFTFSRKEKEYIKDTCEIFRKSSGVSLNITENKINKTTQLYFGCTALARAFQLLFGVGSLDKKLPSYFMQLPLAKQKQLLVGLFRGDGHVRKLRDKGGREFIFETTSSILARQVYALLLRQNIIASFRLPKTGKKAKNQKYSIHLYGKDIEKFFSEIKIEVKQKHSQKGFIFKDCALLPIKNISQQPYNGLVYNIEVEKDHSYTANFAAVKNCSWTTLYPQFRTMKPEKLLAEVKNVVENYGVKEIMDDSGCFPAGGWLENFCNLMIKSGLNKKVTIDCNMRVNALNQKQYHLMAKAGFRFILYGLESASQNTLDRINKNIKVEDIEKAAKMAKAAGLDPHMTCMIGYPWESLAEAKSTVALTKRLFSKGYIDTLQATIVIPYPGTPLFKYCQENNLLKTKNWDEFDMRRPVMKSPISDAQVKELTQGLYKSVLTPRFILRKILSIRSWDDIKFLFGAARRFFGHLVDFRK